MNEEFINHNHTPGRGHPNDGGSPRSTEATGYIGRGGRHVSTHTYEDDPLRTEPITKDSYLNRNAAKAEANRAMVKQAKARKAAKKNAEANSSHMLSFPYNRGGTSTFLAEVIAEFVNHNHTPGRGHPNPGGIGVGDMTKWHGQSMSGWNRQYRQARIKSMAQPTRKPKGFGFAGRTTPAEIVGRFGRTKETQAAIDRMARGEAPTHTKYRLPRAGGGPPSKSEIQEIRKTAAKADRAYHSLLAEAVAEFVNRNHTHGRGHPNASSDITSLHDIKDKPRPNTHTKYRTTRGGSTLPSKAMQLESAKAQRHFRNSFGESFVAEEFVNHNHTPGRGHSGTRDLGGAIGPLNASKIKIKRLAPLPGVKSVSGLRPEVGRDVFNDNVDEVIARRIEEEKKAKKRRAS